MNITTRILCPCKCGETVTMTDAGFSATTVEVTGCSTSGALSLTFRKSAALDFESVATPSLRHQDGLVVFA